MAVNGYEACCMNCRFWKRVKAGMAGGHCRNDPPVILAMMRPHPSANTMIHSADTFFPMTADTEWCGKHENEVVLHRAAPAIDLSKLELKEAVDQE